MKLARTVSSFSRVAIVATVMAALTLAGCTSTPAASVDKDEEVDQLTVAYTGTGTATLPLFIANDRGYFEDEQLEIAAESFGSAPYPQAVAGEVDIVSGDHAAAMQATVGGLPLVFLAETSRLIPGIHQFVSVASSEYQKPEDLRGARIGVSNLVGSAKFALDALLTEANLTEDDVEISKIALDAIGPALELGNIDVAHLPGSFLDAARQAQDLTTIADFTDLDGLNGLAQAGYYATAVAYDADPGKFERFVHAYQRAAQDAIDDPELLTEYLIKYGKVAASAADRMPLPSQVVESDPAELQRLADLMLDADLLESPVTVGEGSLRVADFYK